MGLVDESGRIRHCGDRGKWSFLGRRPGPGGLTQSRIRPGEVVPERRELLVEPCPDRRIAPRLPNSALGALDRPLDYFVHAGRRDRIGLGAFTQGLPFGRRAIQLWLQQWFRILWVSVRAVY